METAMTKTMIMSATAVLIALSALQAPGALAKEDRGNGHSHEWKGYNDRKFHFRHDRGSSGSDGWKIYKDRNFHSGDDGASRGSYFWKAYRNRHVYIGDGDDKRGSYTWKSKGNDSSSFRYRKHRDSADD
jgi:hypothetical protein